MTDPKQTGAALPDDAGNGMSDRAGYHDDSESGRTETPTGTGMRDQGPMPEDTLDKDDSGTTFDAGNGIPGR